MNINMSVFTGDQGWLIFGMVFLLLLMLAMMAAVSIYGFRELKRRRKAYHKISDFLREKTSLKNGILIVPHQDMDFSLRFYGRRKQTPDGFWISATCHAPGFFKISKEGALERLFKRFRLSTEIQTGDPAFDDACYISSDTAQFAFTYLKSVLHRKRIQKLFEMGFKEIKLDDKGLSINFAPVTRVAEKDPSFLMDALNCMAELAGNIPKETLESLAPVSVAWKVKRGLVFGLIGIAVLTAIITGIWTHDLCLPFDYWQLFFDSLKYSLPLLILFLGLSVVFLRGRSTSHIEIIVVCCLAVAAFPIAGFGLGGVINAELDNGPEQLRSIRVYDKCSSTYKTSTSYYVVVHSWRPGRDTEKIQFVRKAYERVQPGKTMVSVATKPGRLGYEWLIGCRIEK